MALDQKCTWQVMFAGGDTIDVIATDAVQAAKMGKAFGKKRRILSVSYTGVWKEK